MRFSCTQCGDCCFEQEVFLDPWDTAALPSDVWEIVLHDGLWKAQLSMVSMLGREACRYVVPLFTDDRCTGFGCALHGTSAKPFVCRSAPLARRVGERRLHVIAPVDGCPGMDRGPVVSQSAFLLGEGVDAERLRRSRWFWDRIAPLWLVDEASARRVYASVDDVEQHLSQFPTPVIQ